MNLMGVVTVVDENKRTAKVTFKSLDNSTSYSIPYARHIASLKVNDLVTVTFFSNNMSDGLIIGVF
jgi:dihydrodipicolinate synthase/N-acetylneuraminate lyase